MWKAIKNYFWSKIKPTLEPVSPVLTPVLKAILPASVAPTIIKATCSHTYPSKAAKQVWVKILPQPGSVASFKLITKDTCTRCFAYKRKDIH